jgi:hypothetical protein
MASQLARGHDAKGPHGRQRTGFRAAQRVPAVPSVVHSFSLTSAWQVEVAHENVARIDVTRIAAPLWLAFVAAVAWVAIRRLIVI